MVWLSWLLVILVVSGICTLNIYSFLGMIMVRPGVNPHVETLGTRVRFTTSPPYAYTSGVSQPNEISVVAVDDSSVEIHTD